MVKVGNLYYFLFIFITLILFISFYLFLKKKSKKYQYNFILIICFLNLTLHFLKLFFEPYVSDFPYSIRKITFENICAISTLLLPFVVLYKKSSILNNYFFFISLAGGLGAIFYPTEAFNKNLLSFDVLRFYYCHITLFLVPTLAGSIGLFRPNYKKFYQIPILFLTIEMLILINEFLLYKTGLISSSITEFFSRETRNSSFVFGPLPAFDKIANILLIFVPKIFTKNIFHIEGLDVFYWPVVWMIIPAFIYLPLIYEIIILPFSYKDIRQDISNRHNKGTIKCKD